MKIWAHLVAAFMMAVTTAIICGINQDSEIIRSLDRARLYTLKRIKPDTDTAQHVIKAWIPDKCQAVTNLSLDPECLQKRVEFRDKILDSMDCTRFASQTCSYLRLALQSMARNSTTERVSANATSPFKVFGTNLKAPVPPSAGESFKDMFIRIIQASPKLFHGAFKAEESNQTEVLRSSMYCLITLAIFANTFMHALDSLKYAQDNRNFRFGVRAFMAVIQLVTSIILVAMHPGNIMVHLLIMFTGLVTLVYFEMLLDPTIVRPWIHPFTFSVVYMSSCVLGLVENGILDYHVFTSQLIIAMCVSQLYMAVAWFYVGQEEKLRGIHRKEAWAQLYQVYITKETQLALYGSVALILLIPLLQVLAPYNYTLKSLTLAASPALFSALSMFTILWVQNMHLDDEYGEDKKNKAERKGWHMLTPHATYITGAKLYSSMGLLAYGTLITLLMLWDHFQTYRAYLDVMPENSIQYDPSISRRYLIGQGMNTLYVQ
jgi:hypothetical protein